MAHVHAYVVRGRFLREMGEGEYDYDLKIEIEGNVGRWEFETSDLEVAKMFDRAWRRGLDRGSKEIGRERLKEEVLGAVREMAERNGFEFEIENLEELIQGVEEVRMTGRKQKVTDDGLSGGGVRFWR